MQIDDGTRHKSFWATIPGILTGVAAVITAIGVLISALYKVGLIDGVAQIRESESVPVVNDVKQLPTGNEGQIFVISGDWDASLTPQIGLPYKTCLTVTQSGNQFTAIIDYVGQHRPPGTMRGFISASDIKISYRNPTGSGTGVLKALSGGQILDGTWEAATDNNSGSWLWRKRDKPCP